MNKVYKKHGYVDKGILETSLDKFLEFIKNYEAKANTQKFVESIPDREIPGNPPEV